MLLYMCPKGQDVLHGFFERIDRNEKIYLRRRRCYRHRVRVAAACRYCCISDAYRRAVVLSRRSCGLPYGCCHLCVCVVCVYCVGTHLMVLSFDTYTPLY